MGSEKIIPSGFMTVGVLAKKMGTTVRTLQYYDKEGLLSPSAESEGGRRLYSDKDMIVLYQILTLKSLGFSLDDIKKQLLSLDSAEDVAKTLSMQADVIRQKVKDLSESLHELELLQEEVLRMKSVDFKKYADIIVNLQMKNQFYRLIKHFDEKTMDCVRMQFDKETSEQISEKCALMYSKAYEFFKNGIKPESEEGQNFAKEFWAVVMEFTGGDEEMIKNLINTNEKVNESGEWNEVQQKANEFIGLSLGVYFENLQKDGGVNG